MPRIARVVAEKIGTDTNFLKNREKIGTDTNFRYINN